MRALKLDKRLLEAEKTQQGNTKGHQTICHPSVSHRHLDVYTISAIFHLHWLCLLISVRLFPLCLWPLRDGPTTRAHCCCCGGVAVCRCAARGVCVRVAVLCCVLLLPRARTLSPSATCRRLPLPPFAGAVHRPLRLSAPLRHPNQLSVDTVPAQAQRQDTHNNLQCQ